MKALIWLGYHRTGAANGKSPIKEKLSASVAKAAETRLLMDQKLKAVYVRAEKRQEALEAQISELREREGELKALVHYEKQAVLA